MRRQEELTEVTTASIHLAFLTTSSSSLKGRPDRQISWKRAGKGSLKEVPEVSTNSETAKLSRVHSLISMPEPSGW